MTGTGMTRPHRTAGELLDLHWQNDAGGKRQPVYAVRDELGEIVDWACGRRGLNWMRGKAAGEPGWTVDRIAPPKQPGRNSQLLALRAAAPKRSDRRFADVPRQDDASALPLFVAANEPRLL